MKKLLLMLLAFVLVLAGCGNQAPEETSAPTTEPTEPSGLYAENSAIEQKTQGAVRVYDLDGTYESLTAIGSELLLYSAGEQTKLHLLTGPRLLTAAELELPFDLTDTSFRTIYSGLVYYDKATCEAVYLNSQLQETERVKLPEDIQGYPAFSSNGNEIFYCVGQEIRVLDSQQGFSRLIKSHTCKSQALLDCYFDGNLLACSVENEAGEYSTLYISGETGQTLYTDDGLLTLRTYDDTYFVNRMDGSVEQRLFGSFTQQPGSQLNVWEGSPVSALELGGIVCYNQTADTGMQLDFYELESGKKTSSVVIPTQEIPLAFYADRWSGNLWILTKTQLLSWNVKKTPVQDEQIYTSQAYTASAPDEAGLNQCRDRADDLEDKHSVAIRLWQSAVKYTGGYSVEPEYQTRAINNCLDQLDAVMSELPEYFLYKSVNTRIRICIVRSIAGSADAVQYWYDGDAFILLPAAADVRNAFMDALSYVVDSHVLGNSPAYDYWNALNPEGFIYGDETTYSQEYLEGENVAFFSEEAMTSVTEDRCQVFLQAVQPDNAEAFQSEIMQKKLLLLCQAIRDAWRWEKKSETYIWEQYLTEPIAYKK